MAGPQNKPKHQQWRHRRNGEARPRCLAWTNEVGTDGQKAPFARRGGGSYVVSGSGGLPGTFLSQQVFDRVLDPDALVDPLGIIWNTETGGESPEQSGNSSPNFPQTSRHLNAPQF